MKIAVCFSGQIRTGVEAAPNLALYFENHLIDYFVHTWNITTYKEYSTINGMSPARRFNLRSLKHPVTPLSEERQITFRKIYNPKEMIVEHYNGQRDPLYHSWKASIDLCKQYSIRNNIKYDLIIKLRPDLIFPTWKKLTTEIEHFKNDPSKFYVDNYSDNRIDDVHWYSTPELMYRACEYPITGSFADYMKSAGIECSPVATQGYAPYRPECLKFSPIENFVECHYYDQFWYSTVEVLEVFK